MSGYDDMARHVRDALEESEIHGDGSCTITPEYYLILNADFEAWDEADDAKRVSEERRDEVERDVIVKIARAAHAIAWQAGVGGRETAGAIVSYLATSPGEIAPFLAGDLSPADFAGDWMRGGCLSWQTADGKVWTPEVAAKARAAKEASE